MFSVSSSKNEGIVLIRTAVVYMGERGRRRFAVFWSSHGLRGRLSQFLSVYIIRLDGWGWQSRLCLRRNGACWIRHLGTVQYPFKPRMDLY
jgi:hypothetical protein